MTKILVLGLNGASASMLLEDDRLESVRRLMALGCYGPLDSSAALNPLAAWNAFVTGQETVDPSQATPICRAVQAAGGHVLRAGWPDSTPDPSNAWDDFRARLQSEPWRYVQFSDPTLARVTRPADLNHATILDDLDAQLGATLELLDDQTIVLVLSAFACCPDASPDRGAFVLAAPPLADIGFMEGVQPIDLAPTLLRLAGLEVPPTMSGQSLYDPALHGDSLNPTDGLSAEDLIKERLRGLGYIL